MSEQLNNLIAEKVKTKLEEQGIQVDEGFLDKLRARAAGFTAGAGQGIKNAATAYQAGKAAIAGDKEAAKAELDKTASVKDAAKTRALQSRMKGAAKSLFKVIDDIEKDLEDLGLDKDERIVGNNSAMSALKTLRTKMTNVLKELLKDATESLEQEAPVQTEETEELEEGACPKCGMSPCACPMHEEVEDIEEEKMPDKNKDGIPDYAQDGKGSKDLGKAKGADSDNKEEKEDEDKEEKSDKDMSKVPPQLRKHVAKKKVDENELTDIKKKQSSINGLNENRLMNVNKELMRRLLK